MLGELHNHEAKDLSLEMVFEGFEWQNVQKLQQLNVLYASRDAHEGIRGHLKTKLVK